MPAENYYLSLTLIIVLSISGLALVCAALKIVWTVRREMKQWLDASPEAARKTNFLDWINERRWFHESQILSVPDNLIRNMDGSYSAVFAVDAGNTLFKSDLEVNLVYEKWAELAARYNKKGYVVQTRATNHLSEGEQFQEFLTGLETKGIHREARSMYLACANQTFSRISKGDFKESRLSVWIKVPTSYKGDQSTEGWKAYWQIFKQTFSLSSLFEPWFRMYELKTNKIVKRLRENEHKCRLEAEKVFRQFQTDAPQKVKRLGRADLQRAVFLGHNERAKTIPKFVEREDCDLRPYLGAERIVYGEDIIYHASTPVAIVSIHQPPGKETEVGIMRAVNLNPTLKFRHTIISDFIPIPTNKALNKLNKNIDLLEAQKKDAETKNKESKKDPRLLDNLERLVKVRNKLGQPGACPVQARVSILVYGPAVRKTADKERAAKFLEEACENLISVIHLMPGAAAFRENGEDLKAIYPLLIPGELTSEETGREFEAESRDILAVAAVDGDFKGTKRGEMWVESVSGELIPLTLYRPEGTTSPGVIIVAGAGGGKSFLIGTEILAWLNYFPSGRVILVDYGGSFAWLAKALNGRVFEFRNTRDAKVLTYNAWYYPGLEAGEDYDDRQVELVVKECLKLSGTLKTDPFKAIKEGLLDRLVRRVYENTISLNRTEGIERSEKHEPILGDLYRLLENYDLTREPAEVQRSKAELLLTLERWLHNPWINSRTSDELKQNDRFVIFELSSLDDFADDLKDVLAARVVAAAMNTDLNRVNGRYVNNLKIFDEMHENKRRFPMIADAIDVLARRERKSMGVIALGSQNFKDVEHIEGVLTNTAIKIAGKQNSPVLESETGKISDFKALVNNFNLNERSINELKNITNVAGVYAQFLVKIESGKEGTVGMFRNFASPLFYWAMTTTPEETNARARVEELTADFWTYDQMLNYLAGKYPFGLKDAMRFDDSDLVSHTNALRFFREDLNAEALKNRISLDDEDLLDIVQNLILQQPANIYEKSVLINAAAGAIPLNGKHQTALLEAGAGDELELSLFDDEDES